MSDIARMTYSISEVAALLGCSQGHVRNLIKAGRLERCQLGARVFIKRDAVERMLATAGEADTHG